MVKYKNGIIQIQKRSPTHALVEGSICKSFTGLRKYKFKKNHV